jgi:hypothetical protein
MCVRACVRATLPFRARWLSADSAQGKQQHANKQTNKPRNQENKKTNMHPKAEM